MIHAAADAGVSTVKIQSYSKDRINLRDSQRDWLRKAHLDEQAHRVLMGCAQDAKVQFLSTPFDRESLQMLRDLGLTRFKIASSESGNRWYAFRGEEQWLVSHPWGEYARERFPSAGVLHLTAIPLYPTPLEVVGRAPMLDGWSDHCEGLSACYRAIALGATVLEVHMKLPGFGREMPWDKSPADIRQLRQFADDVQTMQTGVAQRFRERWTA
jgi:N,N'-diacetyllegionaminate synthase